MKEVNEFIKQNIDFSSNPNIVIAVSGGPDSMVLLNVFIDLKQKYKFNIICAHINHNVRKESNDEKIFLEKYCEKNDVIFEYMKINNYSKEYNFHLQAHNFRYEFFDKLVKKYNSKYLLTAHHGDDLIETILMRITRGSNLKGYSGFELISKRSGYNILRPLVYLTKDEIKKYAEIKNIPFVTDKSNEKDYYTRNRYRKYILPVLKKENKNIHKKYIEFNSELLKYEKYISKVVNDMYSKVIDNNIILIDKFKTLDILLKEKIIEKYLANIYNDGVNQIKNTHKKKLIELCDSKKPNLTLNLPNNFTAVKSYNTLIIKTIKQINKFENFRYELKDKVELNPNETIEIVKNSDNTSNYCIRLNSNEIKLPLYIRNRLDGDRIYVKGLHGNKKVKEIFIDSKIPINQRNHYPLLVDSNDNVLFIPGLKKSKYDKSKGEKYDIIIEYNLKKEEKHEEK